MALPQSVTVGPAEYALDIDRYTTALNTNNFTITLFDNDFYIGGTPPNWTAPQYTIKLWYNDSNTFDRSVP